ncbi:hypothetical protein T4D_15741 [Trichinella pseudospiralis]|uniref:Uncharacterized protein n=1 Tax=Trichinella pseudospiralis TaxID=6337 RepID=A0A0V1FNF1_TRIPS|nr:hypothetical protein T4D_15741 [Trichinella pseudospiralis]
MLHWKKKRNFAIILAAGFSSLLAVDCSVLFHQNSSTGLGFKSAFAVKRCSMISDLINRPGVSEMPFAI